MGICPLVGLYNNESCFFIAVRGLRVKAFVHQCEVRDVRVQGRGSIEVCAMSHKMMMSYQGCVRYLLVS